MKKKQLTSILLAGIMILGLCVPAFADEGGSSTGSQSTKVEYISDNDEHYLLTVPASLVPGEEGIVELNGSWPSTRTMKVSTDANVVLTNSIKSSDKKTLAISFNEISLTGDNNNLVEATGVVGVEDITNANFGEWSGRFSYHVNSDGMGAVEYQIPTMTAGSYWYKSSENKDKITSIKMVDSYTPTGNEDETWYADENNGTVQETRIKVYRTGTNVIIAGNGTGKIMASTNCDSMFSGFKKASNIDISILDTSNTTDMSMMFYLCGFSSIDLSNFDTSNVSRMGSMFSWCKNLQSIDLSGFDTTNTVYFVAMFNACTELETIDLSNFSMVQGVNMKSMFIDCSKLSNIYVGNNWNIDKITSGSEMFYGCTNLPNFDSSVVDKTNAHTGEGGYLTLKV